MRRGLTSTSTEQCIQELEWPKNREKCQVQKVTSSCLLFPRFVQIPSKKTSNEDLESSIWVKSWKVVQSVLINKSFILTVINIGLFSLALIWANQSQRINWSWKAQLHSSNGLLQTSMFTEKKMIQSYVKVKTLQPSCASRELPFSDKSIISKTLKNPFHFTITFWIEQM